MRHATAAPRDWAAIDPRVRGMYERVLASWAMDVLALRRRGLDRPGARCERDRPAARGGR